MPQIEQQPPGDDLLDFASGIFEFDFDGAEDFANSLDDDCAMFLDMDSDLGLALDDNSLDSVNIDLGIENDGEDEQEGAIGSAAVDENHDQDNHLASQMVLDVSTIQDNSEANFDIDAIEIASQMVLGDSTIQDNSEANFEIDETERNVNDVLKMLEGIDKMPWFDALLN